MEGQGDGGGDGNRGDSWKESRVDIPGTQGLRQEQVQGPALTWTQHEKSPLAEPGKWLGKLGWESQFELSQPVRNEEINQHNKTRCRKPGGCCGIGSFGTLGSASTPGATEGVQYKELWRVAPRNEKSWMTRWIYPTLNLSMLPQMRWIFPAWNYPQHCCAIWQHCFHSAGPCQNAPGASGTQKQGAPSSPSKYRAGLW